MPDFNDDLILRWLEQRKATLATDYIEPTLADDKFMRAFQEAMIARC